MNQPSATAKPSATVKNPSWTPPPAWKLQILSADGTVIAEASRRPHGAPVITGSPEHLTRVIAEVRSLCRFFEPAAPFEHGHN